MEEKRGEGESELKVRTIFIGGPSQGQVQYHRLSGKETVPETWEVNDPGVVSYHVETTPGTDVARPTFVYHLIRWKIGKEEYLLYVPPEMSEAQAINHLLAFYTRSATDKRTKTLSTKLNP